MTLVLSLVLALIPLLGVVWIAIYGSLTTVDGLFMSLILLAMSGILVLNALLELKNRLHPSASGWAGGGRRAQRRRNSSRTHPARARGQRAILRSPCGTAQ